MSPRIHAGIIQIFIILSFVVAPIFLCTTMNSFIYGLVFMMVYALLYIGLIYWIPVACHQYGCTGGMGRTMERISFLKAKLTYSCKSCMDTYEAEILYPNITIEFSS